MNADPIPMDDDGGALAAGATTKETQMTAPKVYAAIARITAALATEGISKSRSNAQQGYKFRGIDDVYNALARHLANAGLCVLPSVLSREVVERQTKSGSALFYVTVQVAFAFVCAEDGSSHIVTTYGEAMDSADKATNKAMSAAYKYAAMQAFCIPTEGDNDADATTHEVAARAAPPAERDVTDQEVSDALMLLAEEATEGMAAVQQAMEGLRPKLQAHLRKAKKAELASIKIAATKNEAPEPA